LPVLVVGEIQQFHALLEDYFPSRVCSSGTARGGNKFRALPETLENGLAYFWSYLHIK
jgi:hypothetical protein